MKKKQMFMGTGMAAVCGAVLLGTVPAYAAGQNYTGVKGATTKFDTYLVMDKDANVPNASFTYTITAGTEKNYDVGGKKFEVLSGVGTPTISDEDTQTAGSQVVFATTDPTNTTVQSGDQVKDFDPATQKYAKKEATIDFTSCTFTEPGIYRYVISESGTNQGISNDAEANRYLDVYVIDKETGLSGLEVKGYILHANDTEIGAGATAGSDGVANDSKSQGYTNVYATGNLTFKEGVSGNQASRDKYFAYTVEITGATAGTTYQVDLSKADAVSGTNAATIQANKGQTNPATLTVPAGKTSVTGTFYMQNNQEITIRGLAENTRYKVTANAEDYKSTPAGVTGYADAPNGTIQTTTKAAGEVKTSYLHERAGVIPTGVLLKIFPFAAMMIAGAFGIFRFAGKRR